MNTKKLSYLFVVIALILVLAAAVLTVAFNTNYAYADYLDFLSDTNSIVNFNQLQNFTPRHNNLSGLSISQYNNWCVSFNGTFTGVTGYYKNYDDIINLYANHIYLFKLDSNYSVYIMNNSSNTTIMNLNNGMQFYNPDVNVNIYFGVHLVQNNSYNFYVGCYVIDLTQMFGSGNEPNLQQCQELFVVDYYPYNTGTALSFGTINSYNKGVEDTLNSFDLTLSQYLVGSTAFAFNNSTISDSTLIYDNTVNAYVFKNVIGVPLMDTIDFGTNFTVDFTLWNLSTGESESYYMSQYLNFGYIDNNNNLVNISKLSAVTYVSEAEVQYTGVFVLPVSTDTIYIWVSYLNDTFSDDRFIALDSNITFRSLNVASLIKASYAAGLQANKDFYSVGGAGYNHIFQSGYNAGTMEVTPYTFSRLLTAVIEAPLGAVLEIFNFDFMGYNFKNFITVMFTLCLIIAIVRMFMGGKE